jgi:hypothetical protein
MDVAGLDVNWILMGITPLLIVAIALIRKRAVGPKANGDQSFGRLAEVIKSAEVANDGFFRSLELVQKNLESLIARAEGMEQRLQSLMLHPGIDKREQYTAAALLLAEGQEAERVASMLNLPAPQVQLIRDLQQVTARDKRATTRGRRSEDLFPKETVRASKTAASQEKTAARPILLVDVIKSAANESIIPDGQLSRLEGAAV